MDNIIYCIRYSDSACFIGNGIERVARNVRHARSVADLRAARNQLAMLADAIKEQEERLFSALIRYAAGDDSKDGECRVHFTHYQADCLNCEAAQCVGAGVV